MWIRSQDGMSLRQYDGIFVNYLDGLEVCGDSKFQQEDTDPHFALGRYETEERALEVLNEIQNNISYIELAKIRDAYPISEDDFIYEMPKE